MTPGSTRADARIALPWIVRLRYAIAAGQAITCVFVDQVLGIDLPLVWLAIPPLLVALSNLWLARQCDTDGEPSTLIGWIFVLDTLCLSVALMLSGGPNNPFSLLYLVHITLAATILTQRQTWGLGALACLCFGLLFLDPMPVPALEMHPRGGSASLHLVGMWIAFALASALVTIFSGRISALLRERERSLLHMQEELAKKDRLASLVTLAAGAAHELSTPLGTIAVVAKELEHYATHVTPNGTIAEDCKLIRHEVNRCSGILQRMSLDGAEPVGEALEEVSAAALLRAVESEFPSHRDLRIESEAGAHYAMLHVPRHAVEQALIALVKNGLDASEGKGSPVRVTVHVTKGAVCLLRFEVTDCGSGMDTETLRHAGEPFFTTKEPGKGMGLGIFLVRTLAERLDGRFELRSQPGSGTRAVLELPCQLTSAPRPAEQARAVAS